MGIIGVCGSLKWFELWAMSFEQWALSFELWAIKCGMWDVKRWRWVIRYASSALSGMVRAGCKARDPASIFNKILYILKRHISLEVGRTLEISRNKYFYIFSIFCICLSWNFENKTTIHKAPIIAYSISDCVSHSYPCVPRNDSADCPDKKATPHSKNS